AFLRAELFPDATDELAALGSGDVSPFLEGVVRLFDCGVYVIGVRPGNGGERATVDGRARGDGFAAGLQPARTDRAAGLVLFDAERFEIEVRHQRSVAWAPRPCI